MFPSIMFLGFLTAFVGPQDLPDSAQFLRMVREAMSPVRDQAFVFEGTSEWLGEKDRRNDYAHFNVNFQCSFAMRSDGLAFQDMYRRELPMQEHPVVRNIGLVLKDSSESIQYTADTKEVVRKTSPHPSYVRLTGIPGSPMLMNFTWFFANPRGVEISNYRCHGYEKIDGYPCLHVEFDFLPNTNRADIPRIHYWVDLEHGGHSRRFERWENGKLALRTSISLDEVVSAEHERLWFPLRAITDDYRFNRQFHETPVIKYQMKVVDSSLRINSGLPDSVFAIPSKGGVVDTSDLAALREAFDQQGPVPRMRTDIPGVEEQLKKDLEKADAISARLEAPENPGESGDWLVWAQLGLGLTGLAVLVFAVFLRWRQ